VNPNLSKEAIKKIEILCVQGCSQINLLLEKAEKGDNITELSEFSRSEVEHIIDELGQIMSVYDANNIDTDTTIK